MILHQFIHVCQAVSSQNNQAKKIGHLLMLMMSDLGNRRVVNSIGVVNRVNFEVSGPELHDAGLQGVPPPSPSVPNNTVICQGIVVPIGVVHAVQMG